MSGIRMTATQLVGENRAQFRKHDALRRIFISYYGLHFSAKFRIGFPFTLT